MAESLIMLPESDRETRYRFLLPQIKALMEGEKDIIANMANLTAVLKEAFRFLWVGFYRVNGKELVLGPFQGTIACTRIPYGKGVCGTAWENGKTIIVPDVDQFPGHISCSSLSRSEIVIPLINDQVVWGVLDIDSVQPADFDETDQFYLEKIIASCF